MNGLYRQQVPLAWWLERRSYTAFILRELSSVFVAWTVVYLLLLVRAVAAGPPAYQRFLDWSANPLMIVVNVVAVAFLLYHAITFMNLTPQAMVVRLGHRHLPPPALLGSIYASWIVVSAFLAWLVVG
jgi:fumarate reductase subunit C